MVSNHDHDISVRTDLSRLCEGLGEPLEKWLEVVRLREGESVGFERNRQRGFYSIAFGHIALEVAHGPTVAVSRICGPTDLVGYGNWRSSHSDKIYKLRALNDVCMHYMTRISGEAMFVRVPRFSEMVTGYLCDLLAEKVERISSLECLSVKGRVAALMVSLSSKFGVDTGAGRLIDFKCDRGTLARLAGTSTESFSRTLTELEEEGLIARSGRKILLPKVAALKAIVFSGTY